MRCPALPNGTCATISPRAPCGSSPTASSSARVRGSPPDSVTPPAPHARAAAELGAGPLALSRAHRAQTARALLTSTALPAADVAFASGFGSVRQFNDTIREVYDRSPLELRAGRGRTRGGRVPLPDPGCGPPPRAPGVVHLRLPARAPFDAAGVFAWLAARARRPASSVASTDRVRRTLRLPGGPALVDASARAAMPTPSIDVDARLATLADLPPLVARVRRLFDLDADALAIDAVLGADPALAPSVPATPGIRVPGCLDPHELVFRALIGQQVSVKAARTALQRLAARARRARGRRSPRRRRTRRLPRSGDRDREGPARCRTCSSPRRGARATTAPQVLRGPAARVRTIVDVAGQLRLRRPRRRARARAR